MTSSAGPAGPAGPAVVAVELCAQGVVITFENLTSAIFPANLLYAARSLATIMIEEDGDALPS